MIKRIMVVVYILVAFFVGMKVHSVINKCEVCEKKNDQSNEMNNGDKQDQVNDINKENVQGENPVDVTANPVSAPNNDPQNPSAIATPNVQPIATPQAMVPATSASQGVNSQSNNVPVDNAQQNVQVQQPVVSTSSSVPTQVQAEKQVVKSATKKGKK